MDHELNPRCGQQIERASRLKMFARQQFETDRAWVGRQKDGGLWIRGIQRHIAPEARSRGAHDRMGQVIISAVGGTRDQVRGLAPACLDAAL